MFSSILYYKTKLFAVFDETVNSVLFCSFFTVVNIMLIALHIQMISLHTNETVNILQFVFFYVSQMNINRLHRNVIITDEELFKFRSFLGVIDNGGDLYHSTVTLNHGFSSLKRRTAQVQSTFMQVTGFAVLDYTRDFIFVLELIIYYNKSSKKYTV